MAKNTAENTLDNQYAFRDDIRIAFCRSVISHIRKEYKKIFTIVLRLASGQENE